MPLEVRSSAPDLDKGHQFNLFEVNKISTKHNWGAKPQWFCVSITIANGQSGPAYGGLKSYMDCRTAVLVYLMNLEMTKVFISSDVRI